MGIVIKTPDQTHAEVDVSSLTIDANGNVSITYQKVLVDDTDGSRDNDGDPVTSTLAAADAQNVLNALTPVVTPLVGGAGSSSASSTSSASSDTSGS